MNCDFFLSIMFFLYVFLLLNFSQFKQSNGSYSIIRTAQKHFHKILKYFHLKTKERYKKMLEKCLKNIKKNAIKLVLTFRVGSTFHSVLEYLDTRIRD